MRNYAKTKSISTILLQKTHTRYREIPSKRVGSKASIPNIPRMDSGVLLIQV